MKSEEKNPTVDANDIAGNADANAQNKLSNSATQGETPAMQPGAPGSDATPATNSQNLTAPTSSQSLVASEMSAGKGSVEEGEQQENKEANPADMTAAPGRRGRKPGTPNKPKDGAPQADTKAGAATSSGRPRKAVPEASSDSGQPDAYGGNFGNSVQTSFQDQERYQNQVSGAGRGEFGAQSQQGGTQGGYGNQYREFDFEHRDSPEDRYYGGPGRYGPQHNAYRDYDGRDERGGQQPYRDERGGNAGYGNQYGGQPNDRRNPYNRPDEHGYDRHGFNDRGGHFYGPNEGYNPRHAGGYDERERRFNPNQNQPDYYGSGSRYDAGRGYNQQPDDQRRYQNQPQQRGYDDGRGNRQDNRNQPDRDDRRSGFQNDNGAGPGRVGLGYANDYGQSSIGGGGYGGRAGREQRPDQNDNGGYGNERRNQGEDQRSSRGGYDNQGSGGGRAGHRDDDQGRYGQRGYQGQPNHGSGADERGRQPQGGPARDQQGDSRRQPTEGYGYGHGRDERGGQPNYNTGDQRNGYGRSNMGDSNQGYGSRGGSYNDEYDNGSGQPGNGPGSPAQGDYTQQERNRNYGPGARQQFRSDKPEGEKDDYGSAPRRNRGRDGENQE